MNDRTERGVLGRMAGAGGGSGTAPRPVRALAQALVRSCEEAFALCVRIAAEREARLAPDAIGDWIDPGALLVALRMPAGAGVLALSPGALAVFTELLTTGRLRSADPATARAPTPTDAALMRRVLDRLLAATDQRLGEAGVPDWPRGMVTDGAFGDPRRLALVFGEAPPRGLRLAASFGDEGARTGTITLLLSPGRVAPARGDDPARHAGAGLWQARLEERVLGARAGIVAVLDRIAMPLAGATAMRPGDELPLRPGAAGRVRLESADGQLLAHGRLGQMQGRIALRLTELAPPPGRPAAAGPAALAAAMPTPQGSSSRFQSGAPGSARDSAAGAPAGAAAGAAAGAPAGAPAGAAPFAPDAAAAPVAGSGGGSGGGSGAGSVIGSGVGSGLGSGASLQRSAPAATASAATASAATAPAFGASATGASATGAAPPRDAAPADRATGPREPARTA